MKILMLGAALLLTAPALVSAGNDPIQGQFYFFNAPIVSNTQHYFNPFASPACRGPFNGKLPPASCFSNAVGGNKTGFGLELLGRRGVGVDVELGYALPNWNFDTSGWGVGSVDASYHFFGNKSRRRLEAFATGGYSLYYVGALKQADLSLGILCGCCQAGCLRALNVKMEPDTVGWKFLKPEVVK